jgi:predicted nucleic acid-binding protein
LARLRTFIDSGVLLAAFKAGGELAENALAILGDPERQFVSSDFVRLELLPKPICYGNDSERLFYETFFASVEQLVRASSLLVEAAEREAEAVGLSAMDALHIAAAKHAACAHFVTAEKPTKPLFRVAGIQVTTIRPLA